MSSDTLPAVTRCAIYARQSLEKQGDSAAIERQVADCRQLAESRSWEVVAEPLIDNDLSASSGKARPAYQRLLKMMRAGSVDAVVVWHVDRLTRRLVDLEEIIGICDATGIRLATVTGDIDLGTDTGRMLARILASVARGEVERKGIRQRRANEQRASAGHMPWTNRPFGYDRIDGEVVVVEAEAAALEKCAQIILDGGTLAAGVRLLNELGLTTSYGKPFNTTTLRRALKNRRYSGRVVYQGADVTAGAWSIILPADVQERIAERLRDPLRRVQQGTEAKHLLSGVARCGRCGAALYATKVFENKPMAYRCPKCTLSRQQELLDEVVEQLVLARLSMPDAASLFAEDEDVPALRGMNSRACSPTG
jgi:site-specific DNA recombinase